MPTELLIDVKDRAGRLNGHIDVDSLPDIVDSGAHTKLDAINTGIAAVQAAVAAHGAGALATEAKAEAIRLLLAAPLTIGLPAGASTSAKQDAQSGKLDTLDTSIAAVQAAVAAQGTALATAAKQDTQATKLDTLHTDLTGTIAMSAVALPLPAGAATSAKQDTQATKLDTLHTDLTGTLAMSAAALPLPAGASTAAKQDTQATKIDQVDTDVIAVRDRLPVALSGGRLAVETKAFAQSTQTDALTLINNAATLAIPQGASAISMIPAGAWTGTVSFEVSFDNAATWVALVMHRVDATSTPTTSTTAVSAWVQSVPPGATNARLRLSTVGTGTVTATVAAGQFVPLTPATVLLGSGTSVVGAFFTPGRWQDESNAALGAAGTFNGATLDLTVTASATTFNQITSFAKELRISAAADVAGTLYLEVSRDNGVTWRRIKSVALAAAAGAGMVFYGEIIHLPSWRYARLVFINGAGAQAFFHAQSLRIG